MPAHLRIIPAALTIALVPGCGESSKPDIDAGLRPTTAYLVPSSYDCDAPAARAPKRPHSQDCYADSSCTSRLVAAHRLGNPFAPENSMSALKASILLGADIVETDIRLSSDGQVVLMHDSTIDRTTDGTGDVASLTLEELQQRALLPDGDDPPGNFSCEHVPTLDELFATADGQIVVELEVKAAEAGVVAAEYLRDRALYDEAFLLCDPDECALARAAVPDVPIMTRPQEAAEVPSAVDYTPTPVMVHIDPTPTFTASEVLADIHAAGAKVYGNAFVYADALAVAQGDLSGYLELFDQGIEVLQAEYAHYALQELGRLEAP